MRESEKKSKALKEGCFDAFRGVRKTYVARKNMSSVPTDETADLHAFSVVREQLQQISTHEFESNVGVFSVVMQKRVLVVSMGPPLAL